MNDDALAGRDPGRRWTREEMDMLRAGISESVATFDKAMGSIEGDARELGERGWTIPMRMLPETVVLIARLIPPSHTDAVFLSLYSEQRGREFTELTRVILAHPLLSRWKPLLEQCVAAYRKRQYLIAVPSLLAIYEGALATAVEKPTTRRGAREMAAEERKAAENGMEIAVWESVKAFTTAIFKSHPFGTDRPLILNRNWVLHGRDEVTWSQCDALRLFQAIHTVVSGRRASRVKIRALFRDPSLYDDLKALTDQIESRRASGTQPTPEDD